MSHFNCLVIHKEEQNIDELMAPYSEELKIKPYIRETKDKCYKKYLQARRDARDKPGSFFAKKQKEEADIIGMSFERFKEWYWGEGRIWDKEGNLLTTYNPNSRWNYYTVGGSWENLLPRKKGAKCNSCLITEVDWKKPIIIYAVVTPGGKWHSRGKMLYFGISDETEEKAKDWKLNFYDHFIKTHLSSEFFGTILDCHI
ncbi:hypothetical protein ES703_55459 [subsurface metagenome]